MPVYIFMTFFYFSESLDGIALKKLVNFVNELMERYFNYVQRRVQLEVKCIIGSKVMTHNL